MNTLLDFRYHRKFVGKNGGNGDIKNQYGKNAPQCIIKSASWYFSQRC